MLRTLLAAATPVNGTWGSGRLLRTGLVSVLITQVFIFWQDQLTALGGLLWDLLLLTALRFLLKQEEARTALRR